MYDEFCLNELGEEPRLPLPVTNVLGFIAYFKDKGRSPACITSYLSALSFVHKLNSLPDPVDSHIVQKSLQGIRKQCPVANDRMPITRHILYKMCEYSPLALSSTYDHTMFRALALLAFHGFFRLGELVEKGSMSNTVQLNGVGFHPEGLRLVISKSKTSPVPQVVLVKKTTQWCPVQAAAQFLDMRGKVPGQFFACPRGMPLSHSRFVKMLNKVLTVCGLDTAKYKGHSFRIGAASEAAKEGFSDAQIRLMGRWRSDAFRKYIRLAF